MCGGAARVVIMVLVVCSACLEICRSRQHIGSQAVLTLARVADINQFAYDLCSRVLKPGGPGAGAGAGSLGLGREIGPAEDHGFFGWGSRSLGMRGARLYDVISIPLSSFFPFPGVVCDSLTPVRTHQRNQWTRRPFA